MAPAKKVKTSRKATTKTAGRQQDLRALKRDLEQAGREFDSLPQLSKAIQTVYKRTEFDSIEDWIVEVGKIEVEPPDDLRQELERLRRKLEKILQESQQGNPKVLERKVPWKYQIQVPFLLDILVEILRILMKLYSRDVRP
jgi:(p)ppGpp synthase/HD superfamily hydrolase